MRRLPHTLNGARRLPSLMRCLSVAAGLALASGCGGADPLRGFAITWRLADAASADPTTAPSLTCDQAGVTRVSIDALSRQSNTNHHFDYDCRAMQAQTPAIAQADYQIQLGAHASDGTSRSQIRFDANNLDDVAADLGLTIFTVKTH